MAETHSPKYAPWGRAVGVLCCLVFGLTSFFGSIFIHGPLLPIMFLWPWLYRRLVEITASMWQALIVATLEKVFRVKVVVTGDEIRRHEKTLLIMNHRTRLDWMFFFCCVFHCKVLNRHKITLKSALKWIPGAGWAMQVAGYIFLERKWELDRQHLTNVLRYNIALGAYPNYLFFPEGTDFTANTKEKSDRYAEKNDVQKYEYVLHPRTTGFIHMVNTLREEGEIQAVHDITVAYPKSIVQSELQLVSGEIPSEVHFHIKRYKIADLPRDEDKLSQWCKIRWREKEEMLRAYFNDENESGNRQSVAAGRRFPNTKIPPLSDRSLLLWFCILAWLSFLVFSLVFVFVSPIGRWYACMIVLFYVIQGRLIGGVEKLEMMLYENGKQRKRQSSKFGNMNNYQNHTKRE